MANQHGFIARFKGSLPQFFPPDDKRSAWMYRLAVLREDLNFEIQSIGLSEQSTSHDAARTTYFLRRIAITIGEAKNIFGREVPDLLKQDDSPYSGSFAEGLRKVARSLETAVKVVRPIRDSIGGHMRPSSAMTGANRDEELLAKRVLTEHTGWVANAVLDLRDPKGADLHEIASAVFLFVWPDVKTDEDLDRRHEEYSTTIYEAAADILTAVDALLYTFWGEVGAPRLPKQPGDA